MDQRSSERARTLLAGRIIFNNRSSVIDCVVWDLSSGGARITFDFPISIPDRFELEIPKRNISAPVRIVWSDTKEHGVAFLTGHQDTARPYQRHQPGPVTGIRSDSGTGNPMMANGEIVQALTALLADHLALHVKTRGLYWHFRSSGSAALRRALDEQSRALLAAVDALAERVQELGGAGVSSLEQAARLMRIEGEVETARSRARIDALCSDNRTLHAYLCAAYDLSGKHGDTVSGGLVDDLRAESDSRLLLLARMRLDPGLR